jgi:chaperonin GroEL
VLEERLARLSLSLAVIRVGAPTDVVRNERCGAPRARSRRPRRRCPRASSRAAARRCCARRRARRAARRTASTRAASTSCAASCRAAVLDRLERGYDGQATIDQVKAMREGHGLDALTGEFGDLFEKGVVDPVRVTRLSWSTRRRWRRSC